MRNPVCKRLAILPLFLLAGAGAWFATSGAQQSVPPVSPIPTEEGQLVVFNKSTWQMRELTKRIPLNDSWPQGQEMERALERFGLTRNTPAEHIPVPAQIAPDVYLVGQDRVSNLTYMIDCGPEGVAVIDPTYASEAERTMANVEKLGRPRKDIRWVVNTHCHFDHAMADKQFRDAGAEIMVHAIDADHIEKGSQVTAWGMFAKQTGGGEFPRCKIDRRLSDGEELKLGNKKLLVIHTPGHTPGSASFLLETGGKKLLFSGDTVLYDYRLGWQENPYADNRQYLVSFEKLDHFIFNGQRMLWDVLLPGHGAISMDRAYLDVKKGRELVAASLAAGEPILSVPYTTEYYRARMYGRPATPAQR